MPNSVQIDRIQSELTWLMRAILVDWMKEVAMEFSLKRETFHLAVNYTDRYLNIIPNISRSQLQLVGVSALSLASKQEEIYSPKLISFQKATDDGYTTNQIKDMEINIAMNLNWCLTPPTHNMWANYLMMLWDQFIELSSQAQQSSILLFKIESMSSITFKQSSEESYINYREIMQLIDTALLDTKTLDFKPFYLIIAFLYLKLGISLQQFSREFVFQTYYSATPNSYISFELNNYNRIFFDFVSITISTLSIHDLLNYILYAASFFQLTLTYELPIIPKNKDTPNEHFEELLQYQTHNQYSLNYIRNKNNQLL